MCFSFFSWDTQSANSVQKSWLPTLMRSTGPMSFQECGCVGEKTSLQCHERLGFLLMNVIHNCDSAAWPAVWLSGTKIVNKIIDLLCVDSVLLLIHAELYCFLFDVSLDELHNSQQRFVKLDFWLQPRRWRSHYGNACFSNCATVCHVIIPIWFICRNSSIVCKRTEISSSSAWEEIEWGNI